ncbi:serine/threonine protein kinase [Undibacterium sp. TS12]|uniref:serine/threonine protein kinase n=1 Tax=Undibacterium sp. TS12 TaxID=2908202 RepID=UPI001F4C8359|nr:serine/threonine protein kinase [Undibacterium sp. TS12]MCH8621618.1 serine/threonine protein kinase [Undibacterium sp. TS12]
MTVMTEMISPDSFAGLTPELVLDAVESSGMRSDGRMLALNSYENRVYQIGIEDAAPVIAKFYRPLRWSDAAIQEEHAFVRELRSHEIPVIAASQAENGDSLRHYQGFRFALFDRQSGRAPETGDRATLEWLGRFIGRIHSVGAAASYQDRPVLNIQTFGLEPRAWLLEHDFIPADLLAAYASVSQQALDGIQRCYDRAGDIQPIRLHGDCHLGNVLWLESGPQAGPHFVDFDDSRMGPGIQDLWMLLSGDRADMQRQLTDILAGYEDFFEFDSRQLYLIEALRTLRLIHYSAWLAQRWHDPAFPAAFPWFNSQRYWQDRILELREQVALMDEPPLWPV